MRAEVTHCTCGGSCSTGSRCCRSGGGSCGCLRALRGSGQYDLGDLGGGFHIPKCSERIEKCQDRILLEYPLVYGYDFRKITIVDQGIIDYIYHNSPARKWQACSSKQLCADPAIQCSQLEMFSCDGFLSWNLYSPPILRTLWYF